MMCFIVSRICSLSMDHLIISDRIPAQNSLHTQYDAGLNEQVYEPSTSNLVARGRMGIARASTESSETKSLIERSSTHSGRPR